MSEPIYVVSLGAVTPLGRDAVSSAAAVRAGISGFCDHPTAVDSVGEPIRVAMAQWLNAGLDGASRFEALLMPAIEEALDPIIDDHSRFRVGVAVGLPAPRPGLPANLRHAVQACMAKRYGKLFVAQGVLESGHAAGLLGMRAALERMADGAFDVCLVAGAESYLSSESLFYLEEMDQLHGAGPLNNAWGFVPGEAAGAMVLAAEHAMFSCGFEPLARVLSVGRAHEPKRIKTQTVCLGEGLTECLRSALMGLPPGDRVTDVYCDMNGEPYRADEFGFAALRMKEYFLCASDFIAPADCWGDVSAAAAPLGVVLATAAARTGYGRGDLGLVWGSSETGERGAALLGFSSGRSA